MRLELLERGAVRVLQAMVGVGGFILNAETTKGLNRVLYMLERVTPFNVGCMSLEKLLNKISTSQTVVRKSASLPWFYAKLTFSSSSWKHV